MTDQDEPSLPQQYGFYENIRAHAKDGDVLLVSSTSAVGLAIRAATFGKMSHVATFLWIDDGLWIYEAREFVGIIFKPASLYIRDCLEEGTNIYFGRSPEMVRAKPHVVYDAAMSHRKGTYGYRALGIVLLSQILDRPIETDAIVCSILAQRMWEATGVKFERLCSPQMFTDYCQSVTRIRGMKMPEIT